MGRRKMLSKSQIGDGFFDGLLNEAKKGLHGHADRMHKAHVGHLKKHLKTSAVQLFAAKDKKAELNKIKARLVKHGVQQAAEIAERVKESAHKHVEKLKAKAVARVRSKVCAHVGAGFFSSIGSMFSRAFNGAKAAAKVAVKQGVTTLKDKVKEAPGMLKQHLMEHKDEYIANAKEGLMDVAMNGKEGVARQMNKAKTHMVKKTRAVAGCKPKGSGLKQAKGSGTLGQLLASVPKRRVRKKGRGLRMGAGVTFKGSGLRVIS